MSKVFIFLLFQFFASSLLAVQGFSDYVQKVGAEPERMIATIRNYNGYLDKPKVPEAKKIAALIVHVQGKRI